MLAARSDSSGFWGNSDILQSLGGTLIYSAVLFEKF